MEDMEDSDDDESSEGDFLDGWGDSEEESSEEEDDDESDYDEESSVEFDKTVEKFICTVHNGNYDTEFDEALSSNRALTATVMPTQASYNKPDNWRERNRIGLYSVKGQLQTCIESATDDQSFELELRHNNVRGQVRNNEGPIVWHEPILDEYWDHLEEILGRKHHITDIDEIHVENVEIKKEHLAVLVANLVSGGATNSSDYITFDNANLCGESIVWLSKLVDVSSDLIWLSLHHNRIDSMDSACSLSRSLKSHTSINLLNMYHCDFGSSPEILLVLLQSDVRRINLSNNNIDSVGAVKIVEYLEGDPPIYELTLENNRFNDNDAILISQSLKRNRILRRLDLVGNNITSIGVKALLNCVFDSSSLNAISESNHILVGMNIFNSTNISMSSSFLLSQKFNGYVGKLLELGKRDKILLALQDKDSLLQYLANVPVELIPEVLALNNGRFDNQCQQKYLNIMYSTMRWWNMPMLYSYHSCLNSDTKRKRDN